MRIELLLPLLILLAGCESEKSFDQRYEDAAGTIENQASSIDRALKNSAMENSFAAVPTDQPSNNRAQAALD